MKSKIRLSFLVFCLFPVLFSPGSHALDAEIERKPLTIGGYMDFGQIISGEDREHQADDGSPINIDRMPLNRMGAGIGQEIIVDQVLSLRVGVGGLFFYPSPQTFAAHSSLTIKFGPGISEAQGLYTYSENAQLQFGFFGYKYNADAANLGEYLFRSNCYPGILYTGGWSFINSAGFAVLGARLGLTHMDGALKNDFLIIVERENFPMNSFSPGYVGSLNLGGAFEIGWGLQWQHLIPMRPSWLTSSSNDAVWVEYDIPNTPEFAAGIQPDSLELAYADTTMKKSYDLKPGSTIKTLRSDGKQIAFTVTSPNNKQKKVNLHDYDVWTENVPSGDNYQPAAVHIADIEDESENLWRDPATGVLSTESNKTPASVETDIPRYVQTGKAVVPRTETHINFRGIKAMLRFSLDIGGLIGMEEAIGPGAFKVFGELAVLGLENQPFYYEDIAKRMPMMLGVNLPTFKLLDVLCGQIEFYDNDFLNSEENHFWYGRPVPGTPNEQVMRKIYYENDPYDWDENNIRWSVYAKRSITDGLRLFVQMASDHMRTIDNAFFFTREPVLNKPSEWYYVVRLDFGF